YAFNGEESASIQRVYNQRYIEGQRAVTDKQTDCAAADRDLTALELTVTSPPAASPPDGAPTQTRAATIPAPAVTGASPQSGRATPVVALPQSPPSAAASPLATLRTLAAVPSAAAATGVLPPISAPVNIATARGITDDEIRLGISAPFSGA